MTESTAQPTPASAETHVAVPSQPQDDFNPVRARRKISGLEKQLQESQERLAALEAGQKTEAERAREEAYNRGKTETEAQFTKRIQQLEIDGSISRSVLAAGFPEDVVHIVKAKIETDDPKEIKAEVDKVLAGLEWARPSGKPRVPGQPGSPTPADTNAPEYPKNGQWDRTQVQELIQLGRYEEFRGAIDKANAEGRLLPYPMRGPR